jgi:peptidoglycan/LPS O-acetylase OafA/YrhL
VRLQLDRRDNNFDVLRLVAASLVLFSHCYPLTGHPEPVGAATGSTLGEVGVVMFFAMSGFLIAKSWTDQPELVPFAVKRALRLLPALAVAVTVTALVVGPLFTTLPLRDYFTDPGTWLYVVRSSVLVTFGGELPGVFTGNVYPDAVNGSLWTLPVEACAYVMAATLGLLGLLRRSTVLLAGFALALFLASEWSPLAVSPDGDTVGADLAIVMQLVAAFVFGSLMFALRDRLRLSWPLLAALWAVWVLTWDTSWANLAVVPAVAYGVLVFAFRTPAALRRLTAPGDVSYGIYVYAFPVQQSVAAIWGAGLRPLVMFALAAVPTYALALLSWRLIERPALRLKRVFVTRRRQPAPPARSPVRVGAGPPPR